MRRLSAVCLALFLVAAGDASWADDENLIEYSYGGFADGDPVALGPMLLPPIVRVNQDGRIVFANERGVWVSHLGEGASAPDATWLRTARRRSTAARVTSQEGTASMKEVYRGGSRIEADFIRSLLDARGIVSRMVGEHAATLNDQGAYPEDPVALWVDDAKEAEAVDIVQHFKAGRESGPSDRVEPCRSCAADLEPQFSACWQCGTERHPS